MRMETAFQPQRGVAWGGGVHPGTTANLVSKVESIVLGASPPPQPPARILSFQPVESERGATLEGA